MFSNSVKNIHDYILLNSPIKQKRSSKLIHRIKFRQSLNKAKLLKIPKNSAPLINQVRRNSDIELKKLKLKLSENEDLNNLDNAKNLILLIKQLNGANLNKNGNKNDPDNNTLITMKKFLELFEKYNFFFYFFSYYNIPNEIILKIIPYIKYLFLPKDEILFKEGDPCLKLYFLLKGKITFTKKLMDGTEVEQFTSEEEGFHFGDWELVNNRYNKYTALCKENTYIVYIPKEIFVKYIQDKLIKVEADIKKYVMNSLRNFVIMPPIKLERFIESNVKSIFFRKNDVIFKKGEETKYLYLIYKGEVNIIKEIDKGEESSFISSRNDISIESIQDQAKKINYKKMIKKSITKDEESKNNLRLEMSLNKTKYSVVTTLTKGSFIGLEISTGIYFFRHTYVCNSDFACILEINIENLDEHLKELMINLMPYFFKLDEKIHEQLDKITLLYYNIQPKVFQKIRTRNKMYRYDKYIDSLKIEENEKTFLKQIKKINKKFETNEAGFIKMNKKNMILQNQKNILVNKLRENYFKGKSYDIFLRNFNQERIRSLKYKNVKMIKFSQDKDKNNKNNVNNNRNNSSLFFKKRSVSFYIPKIRRKTIAKNEKEMGIGDKRISNNYKKLFSKFKSRTSTNSFVLSRKNKNYNLYDIEEKKDMEKQMNVLKNNKMQFTTFMKLQRKKNNIKDIKQGLSLDCKALVKKVYIRNKFQNDNNIYTFIKFQNKSVDNRNNSGLKHSNSSKIIINEYKKDMSKTVGETKKKIIIRNIFDKKEKKLDFYDTGNFDMPLASQLG